MVKTARRKNINIIVPAMLQKSFLYGIFLCCFVVSGQNLEELFLRANEAYHLKQFQKALSFYDAITPKGSVVYYNMGNCWYRLGNYLEALLCWRKAEHNASYALRISLEHNCAKALQKLGIAPSEGTSIIPSLHILVASCPLGMLQILFLCFWFIFILYLCYFRSINRKRLLAIFFMPHCILGLGLTLKVLMQTHSRGIIKEDNTYLCAGTDMQFSKRGVLNKGQEVAVLESKKEWSKVRNANQSGWIKNSSLEVIHC